MTSRRLDRRQGFLISAIAHLMILSLLASQPERPIAPASPAASLPPAAEEPPRRVILLPRNYRELLGRRPSPPPAPPAQPLRDRISIGPPSELRQKGPLELRRDQDLTNIPPTPGRPDARPSPPAPSPAVAAAAPRTGTPAPSSGVAGVSGIGTAEAPRGTAERMGERSIGRSLRDLDRRMAQTGAGGVQGGVGRQMGPLFFDPEGADFTGWVNHFKNEVYRNWIVPQAALFGSLRGHVDFEFWIERDGRLTGLRVLKSSGAPALDRAAQNALTGGRLLPLPSDFGPPRVRMQVSFFYNEGPPG